MRCKYCGSKMLFPSADRKRFSAGKAIAGAVAIGVVGAAAGFIGKEVQGYRCSTCSTFSTDPMDFGEESVCNMAVSDARRGLMGGYERMKLKYPGLEEVTAPSAAPAASPLPEKITRSAQPVPKAPVFKQTYEPKEFYLDDPVFLQKIAIKKTKGNDALLLTARNLGDKSLRSAYFKATVFDDVGDEICTIPCVYQGLCVKPGESLPPEQEFDLQTDLAFRVELFCEKAAFTDGSVWRKAEDAAALPLAELQQLTPKNFDLYKPLQQLLIEKKHIREGQALYLPSYRESHWNCLCGAPVAYGKTCNSCGLDEAALQDAIEYDTLVKYRLKNVQKIAKQRAKETQKLYDSAATDLYHSAVALMDKKGEASLTRACAILTSISGYKDAAALAEQCRQKIAEAKAESTYAQAFSLAHGANPTSKQYMEAIHLFESISTWRDSKDQIDYCNAKFKDALAKEEQERKERLRRQEQERQEQLRREEQERLAAKKTRQTE